MILELGLTRDLRLIQQAWLLLRLEKHWLKAWELNLRSKRLFINFDLKVWNLRLKIFW